MEGGLVLPMMVTPEPNIVPHEISFEVELCAHHTYALVYRVQWPHRAIRV
jgi:hypothetical protein